MKNILIITVMFMSWSFILLNHPLTFGMILLIQTFLISMITGMMGLSFWFSYIMFLIMVGGMLILFIYMTSVASNEKFEMSKMMITIIIIMMMTIMTTLLSDQFFSYLDMKNHEMSQNNKMNLMTMTKFMSQPASMIMTLTIFYLLITLIMVVKITNIQYGPLRQKFYEK
uniref:NADH-ubiquinone oxidoreductase chain 6 n=2 Tax=Cerambycidae TaxID=34667 RepID=A0A5B9RSN2_9CUCU|nr:NADH dehydrogenase subunit 6 [Nortia carinicollis]QEG58677.1 NADH dehydrogenase subunit 6 [Nortia carinicollis]